MTVNRYFDHVEFGNTHEQELVQCLVDEAIQIHGLNIYYIPRTEVDVDYLFGEDQVSNFNAAVLIEMYLETFDGWEGEGHILSKFGLLVPNSATLVVSKKRFAEEVISQFSTMKDPQEGDLLYYPQTSSIFEIKHVKKEEPFYQVGTRYTYKLEVEKFAYSHETLDTGIQDIDAIEDQYTNGDATETFADNDAIETEADGTVTDGFDDSGTDDRGSGLMNFDEQDPFGDY
jgi:hypothetical protein